MTSSMNNIIKYYLSSWTQYVHEDGNFYSVDSIIDYISKNKVTTGVLDLSTYPLSDIIISDDRIYSALDLLVDYWKLQNVDLSVPIIIGYNGSLLDGRHRIVRALHDGITELKYYKLEAPLSELLEIY